MTNEEAIKVLTYATWLSSDEKIKLYPAIKVAINALEQQNKIVRCKDCKYSHLTYKDEVKYCDKWDEIYNSSEQLYLDLDFYCGFGEV